MVIKVYMATLFGDIYDDGNWADMKAATSKEEIVDWVNNNVKQISEEWGVLPIPHDYGDLGEQTVFQKVTEEDFGMSSVCLVLEDNQTNRVFCKLTESALCVPNPLLDNKQIK